MSVKGKLFMPRRRRRVFVCMLAGWAKQHDTTLPKLRVAAWKEEDETLP